MIFESPSPQPGTSTLVAKRATWQTYLDTLPDRPRGDDRPPVERMRAAIDAAMASGADPVRVTLLPEDARRVLAS
jgi:hypothetical protein